MYKIMIVDDEESIREGIASSAPWAAWGFHVAGIFENGKVALAAIEQNPPDVVLSDICMPYMDGVGLMQAINQRFPQVKVVILSGYSDFEYLNMSIKNNVCEYLLKPTDMEDFEKVFLKLRAQLDEERRRQQENRREKQSRHEEWLNLLLKGFLEDEEAIASLEVQRGLNLSNSCVVLLTPDGRLGDDDRTLYRLKQSITQVCNNALEGMPCYFYMNHEEIITGILCLPDDENLDSDHIAGIVKTLQSTIRQRLNVTVSVGISLLSTEPDMLSACFQQAKCCLRQNIFMGMETVFFYSQFGPENTAELEYFNFDAVKKSLLDGDFKRLDSEMERVFKSFDKRSHKNYQLVDQLCIDAMFVISRWSLQYNVRFEQLLDSLGATYTDIYRCDSLMKKQHFMSALFYALHRKINEGKTGDVRRSSLVYMVKNCVDQNFASNSISLESVAEQVRKTPAHISKIFKNELGYNFSEYVTQKRLEKSVELLANPAFKVYEIAERVGYIDPSNFIKVFKKRYGVSPKEFRQTLPPQVAT